MVLNVGVGTVMDQRSSWAALVPVRNGEGDCGESKNSQEVLVKIDRPSGRMRGDKPKRVWERSDSGRK
jgi:hypothetical protein